MKAIIIPDGIVHLAESKAICPKCGREIPFEEIEKKFSKQDKFQIRMKCKCKHYIGITQDFRGDYVAFDLKNN